MGFRLLFNGHHFSFFRHVSSALKYELISARYLVVTSKRCFSEMTRVLNVAEKNDVAKNVANILGRGSVSRREGYSVYNKVYDFTVSIPCLGTNCNMVMTSVSGHLLNYDFTAQHAKWHTCDPKVLFTAPIIEKCNENGEKIKKTLQREVRSSQVLIIWTDCDREGENIGFEIIKVCREINPNLRILRAHFSEITVQAINRALHNLTHPDKKVSGQLVTHV